MALCFRSSMRPPDATEGGDQNLASTQTTHKEKRLAEILWKCLEMDLPSCKSRTRNSSRPPKHKQFYFSNWKVRPRDYLKKRLQTTESDQIGDRQGIALPIFEPFLED